MTVVRINRKALQKVIPDCHRNQRRKCIQQHRRVECCQLTLTIVGEDDASARCDRDAAGAEVGEGGQRSCRAARSELVNLRRITVIGSHNVVPAGIHGNRGTLQFARRQLRQQPNRGQQSGRGDPVDRIRRIVHKDDVSRAIQRHTTSATGAGQDRRDRTAPGDLVDAGRIMRENVALSIRRDIACMALGAANGQDGAAVGRHSKDPGRRRIRDYEVKRTAPLTGDLQIQRPCDRMAAGVLGLHHHGKISKRNRTSAQHTCRGVNHKAGQTRGSAGSKRPGQDPSASCAAKGLRIRCALQRVRQSGCGDDKRRIHYQRERLG